MKPKAVSCILAGVIAAFLAKDCSYNSTPSEKYKQEFETEISAFSEAMKNRKFPRNANTDQMINLSVYVDAEFKRNHDHWLNPYDNDEWKTVLKNSLERSSERFHDEFGISFQVDSIAYWDPTWNPATPEDDQVAVMLYQLENKKNPSPSLLGFTGKNTEGTIAGMADSRMTPKNPKPAAVIKDIRTSPLNPEFLRYTRIPLENLIQHEISHWFGANDMIGIERSIMDYEYVRNTDTWDFRNKVIMNIYIPVVLDYLGTQKNKT